MGDIGDPSTAPWPGDHHDATVAIPVVECHVQASILSIAVCNAAPAVRQFVVTDRNREDGFANAIGRFVLGSAQSGAVVDIARAGDRG
jgi:hypothetical protein